MTEADKNTKPYYPDIIIFLVFIPFISAFNYYLTYSNIRLNGFLVLTFTIDTIQGYMAWWAVRAFINLRSPKSQRDDIMVAPGATTVPQHAIIPACRA